MEALLERFSQPSDGTLLSLLGIVIACGLWGARIGRRERNGSAKRRNPGSA